MTEGKEIPRNLYIYRAVSGYTVSSQDPYTASPDQHAFSTLTELLRHIRRVYEPPKPKKAKALRRKSDPKPKRNAE